MIGWHLRTSNAQRFVGRLFSWIPAIKMVIKLVLNIKWYHTHSCDFYESMSVCFTYAIRYVHKNLPTVFSRDLKCMRNSAEYQSQWNKIHTNIHIIYLKILSVKISLRVWQKRSLFWSLREIDGCIFFTYLGGKEDKAMRVESKTFCAPIIQ